MLKTNVQTEDVILVIDDDPIVTETIEILFDPEIKVIAAYNGSDGIAMAQEKQPDLILLDVRMPGMDGYETCQQLQLLPDVSHIPIIFLTAKTDSTDEAMGLEMGAIDYIVKPLVPQIIKARVKNQLMQKRQRDELENLSSIDALTGIANRRRLDEYLKTEWRRAIRNKHPISLMMIDIDHFKIFNDTYGHQGGDDCLRRVAEAIAVTARRPADLVARYGGEEFCVVLPETAESPARDFAENLRTGIEDLNIEHKGLTEQSVITVSIGVATAEPGLNDLTYEDLIERADKRLYHAKESGRNQVSDTIPGED